jgi:hypothetical protein
MVIFLILLEGLATLLDILMGPGAVMSTEEAYNATSAAMLACGHTEALWSLQYKWFCGGCSTEAVLAAPFFQWWGPTIFSWKWVMGCIHMVTVTAGAAIAGRAAGARSAFVFVGLMVAAPGFYRSLALTGFGNHAESTVFPFVAAAVLLYTHKRPQWTKICAAVMAGVTMGFGIWFSPTVLHGLVAVVVVAVAVGPAAAGAFLVGLPIGLAPMVVYFKAQPINKLAASEWWTTIDFASFSDLVRWLITDFNTAQLWPTVGSTVSSMWWFSLVIMAILGMGAMANRTERPWATRWFVPLLLGGLIGGYLIRGDLWSDNPAVMGFDPFNLRYRAPLFPILALGAALTSGAMDEDSVFRKIAAAGVVVLIATGFVFRTQGFQIGTEAVFRQPAVPVDGRVDWTVPEGEPPTRLDRKMGRPEDIRAAVDFLEGHTDGLSVCREIHLAELGRRTGVGLGQGQSAIDLAPALTLGATLEGDERKAFVRGLVEPMNGKTQVPWAEAHGVLQSSVPVIGREAAVVHDRVHPQP